MFDEDSFSKDDYLGKVLINVEDYIGDYNRSDRMYDRTITRSLEDDPLQNPSKDQISGDITFELR